MKKQILTMVSLLLTGNAGAQTQTGNGLLSGSVGVTHYQSKAVAPITYSQQTWQPSLNLTAGRFVADDWLLGLSVAGQLNFQESTTHTVNGLDGFPLHSSRQQVSVTTTPFVRRYWRFDPVYVFAGAGISAAVSGSKETERGVDYQTLRLMMTNHRLHNVSVDPYIEAGVNYFLTSRLVLQLTASANSLPFSVGGFSTGLTYWTGPDRKGSSPETRENSQTNRGNWLVEGGFSVNNTGYRLSGDEAAQATSTAYSISPSVGYFIGKNSLIGISLPYTLIKNENAGLAPNRAHSWSVGIAPYYQHYFSSTRLTPFVRTSATYSISGVKKSDETARIVEGNVGIGLAYMAGQRFIVETSLANASVRYFIPVESFADTKSWNAGLSAGLSGNFAVRYVLTRAK